MEWSGEERSGEERSLVQFNAISTIIHFSKLSEVNRSSPAMEATHPGQLRRFGEAGGAGPPKKKGGRKKKKPSRNPSGVSKR